MFCENIAKASSHVWMVLLLGSGSIQSISFCVLVIIRQCSEHQRFDDVDRWVCVLKTELWLHILRCYLMTEYTLQNACEKHEQFLFET